MFLQGPRICQVHHVSGLQIFRQQAKPRQVTAEKSLTVDLITQNKYSMMETKNRGNV